MRFLTSLLATAVLSAAVAAQQGFTPPQLVRGDLPGVPPANVVGGGEVLIEAIVDQSGALTAPVVLRGTPPFSNMVLDVIGRWRFTPAHAVRPDGTDGPVDASVLVAAVYRPPTLLNGPTIGEPPKDMKPATPNVPYPISIVAPPYPPQAVTGSVVLFEVLLDETGQIKNARAIGSDPGFDSAARDALLQWKFRPSTYRGRPAPAAAYVLLGFSPPVVSAPAAVPSAPGK